MKIIATTGSIGFILQATANELAQIAGYANKGDASFRFKEGQEILVSDIYKQLDDLIDAKQTLTNQAAQLRVIANQLEAIEKNNPVKGNK